MKSFIAFFSLFLLVACQSPSIQTNTSYFKPDSVSTIEITQPLGVAPNFARAFLQAGNNISPIGLDLSNVNCEVEINTISEVRQVIQPEKFNVVAIAQEESSIVMLKPLILASLNYASSGPPEIKRFFRFHLSAQDSNSKSQVRALLCRGVSEEHADAQLPTLEQMQAATGNYIKFNL
ncbi:MAG: hypothetical protein OQL19_14455 [Gammaproteobacteria bacterium]|nr:hypothetical protein [Gammaproteobacteria bacterium]